MDKQIINGKKINNLFSGPFEFIDTGFSDGDFNMKFDYDRTMAVSEDNALPMFRLYGWNPWTVSLGYNQKEEDIDKSRLEKKGFGLVRRPTGGRAVLHADEITYSVVLNLPENYTAQDAYRDIHIVLADGLRNLGAPDLGFEKSQPDFADLYKKQGISVSCFASSARFEIEWKNKKIVGSAQRLFGRTLLQHGSILLAPGHEQLSEVAAMKDESKRKILYEYTKSHSVTMTEICNRRIRYEEAAKSILNSLNK